MGASRSSSNQQINKEKVENLIQYSRWTKTILRSSASPLGFTYLKPTPSNSTTTWRQLLSCGPSSEFLVTPNLVQNIILPLFKDKRNKVTFGNIYSRKPNLFSNVKCNREIVDIVGLILSYFKCKCCHVSTYPMFR